MAASMPPDADGDRLSADYYSFLNISKEASKQEINEAYRRMCKMFHPDRHVEPEKKKLAEQIFHKLKKVHETLIDEHKRVVYDLYGEKGLETYGMEVVSRVKTPAEIIAEYKRYQEEQEQNRLQKRTNPRGMISMGIDVSPLVAPSKEFEGFQDRPSPGLEIGHMNIEQSVECPLTTTDTAIICGRVNAYNGRGDGMFIATWRTLTSSWGWREVEATIGNDPSLAVKGSRQITKKCVGTASISWSARSVTHRGLLPRSLKCSLVYRFDKNWKGQITYNVCFPSSVNNLIVYENEKHRALFSIQLGIPRSFILTSYTRKFPEAEAEAVLTLKTGNFGSMVMYGVKKKISSFSTLGATMEVGVPGGVTLRVTLSRGQQTFMFPIFLSDDVEPTSVFFGTLIPVVAYFIIKRVIVDPVLSEQKAKEAEKTQMEQAEKIAQKRREAQALVDLMKETVENSIEVEESKMGLVIVRGLYGKLVSNDQSEMNERDCIDVTIPLQALVKDSKLIEPNGMPKDNLPGFYDPCIGEEKMLYIRYKFRNRLHHVTLGDKDTIRLPQQKHLILDDSDVGVQRSATNT